MAVHNWAVNGVISLPYLAVAAAMVLVLGLVALQSLGLVDAGQSATGVRPWVGSLFFAWLFTRLSVRALTRGVVASPGGLRVRRVFMTQEISWCDIDGFRVHVDAHPDQMTWYACVVDGSVRETDRQLPIASASEGKARRYVERLNAALAEHRSSA